ncbi:MAG: Valyl-tRNA synthetase, partial [uncultured Chloroflexia bacterium]
EGRSDPVAAGGGPRRNRGPMGGREDHQRRRALPPRPGARGVRGAHMGLHE